MEIFGIGILEFLFIVLIALIVLGPKDMVKAGRMMGQMLRKLMLAPGFMEAQRWVRNLPAQLMREAGIEEILNDLRKEAEKIKSETTIMMNGEQPAISNTTPRSPALTPYQESKPQAEIASPVSSAESPVLAQEIVYPALSQPPVTVATDVAQEWTGVAAAPVARTRAENLNEFPAEWLLPPEPVVAQETLTEQDLTQPPDSDVYSVGSENADESDAGNETEQEAGQE